MTTTKYALTRGEPHTILHETDWGWVVWLENEDALFPRPLVYIGSVERCRRRFKAKYNARLVRSEAAPNGIYPSLEEAVAALMKREQ